MPSYTVPINGPNGPGFMTVNASDPAAAVKNATQGGNTVAPGTTAILGGHQATSASGTAVALPGLQPSAANPTAAPVQGSDASMQAYIAAYQKIMDAVAARDDKAFAESIREYDQQFGLDTQKFQQDILQFNQNLALAQAQLTGVYNGQQTQQAQQQAFEQAVAAAGLTGLYQGQQTQAAQQQAFAQQQAIQAQQMAAQQQAYTQGTGVVQLVSGLQANPFRQQAAMGQLSNLLGGGNVSGFGQIGTVPGAGTGGLGYLQQMIDDIKSPTANQTTTQGVLDAIPTPNKLDSVNFFKAPQTTQNLVLQGMQEKYGIDPNDALAQIKQTLPGFQAPTTYGTVKRPTF